MSVVVFMPPPPQSENTAPNLELEMPEQSWKRARKGDGCTEEGALAGSVLLCKSVEDWLQPRCAHYSGLHVPRRQTWEDVQHHVDAIVSAGLLWPTQELEESIPASELRPERRLAGELSERAQRIVDYVSSTGLPDDILQQIRRDIEEVGMVVARMLPAATELIVKLETIGANMCSRWHQDNYVCRAIICYNGSGTNYANEHNVDFWELRNCGNNQCILRDQSQVMSINAGDILFMKGLQFPGSATALVHKSPEKRYHADGAIMSRLCLKIDVPRPQTAA